jgi:hypothetical protein
MGAEAQYSFASVTVITNGEVQCSMDSVIVVVMMLVTVAGPVLAGAL